MDQESGSSAEDIRREQLQRVSIITSKNVPAGVIYRTENSIICSPANDLVWEHTWASFLMKQRKMGSNYVQTIANDLRFKLGLPVGPDALQNRYTKIKEQLGLSKDSIGRLAVIGGYREEETRQ